MIYKNFKKSKVKDIKKDSSFFNAINLAVERDILDLSLGGDFKPGENVSALEVIRAFEILLNK